MKYWLIALFVLGMSVLGVTAATLKKPHRQIIKPVFDTNTHAKAQEADRYIPRQVEVETIFQKDKSYIATISAHHIRTVVATGDIIPARGVNFQTVVRKDFTWPEKETAVKVKDADITFINLEAPIMKSCHPTNEGMVFCGSDQHIQGLQLIGTDVANLGNNHAGNHGQAGIDETTSILKNAGIDIVGVPDSIAVRNVRGIKFAFLGYTDIEPVPWVSRALEDTIKVDIQRARSLADVVIVQYHWGAEYRAQPDDRQKYLAHFTVDSGADVVIGNHPHWIQPVEIYKGKLITYAHGNYIFDQMWSQETREGVIGKYYFYDKTLIDVEYSPLLISEYGRATFLDGQERQKILDNMKKQSEVLSKAQKL